MEEQQKNHNTSDEIDLGQLFQMIGRGFNKLGIGFLRLFLYLKRRAFILGGLILLGLGIGYGLNQITEEKKKIEVIVKPNLDSKNYLYDVIDEIQSNIKSKDTSFFKSLDIPTDNLGQYEIAVEPIEGKKDKKEDFEFLELLEKFQNNSDFSDLLRSEMLKNSVINHRIIITFKNPKDGQLFAKKILEYINDVEFFNRLLKTSNENASSRIKQNEFLIQQIDIIIANYTKSILEDKGQSADNTISLDNEKPMDVTGLFELKNKLIENSERKKLEMQIRNEPITVLNFGKSKQVVKPFFGKNLVLIPFLFVGLFFTMEFIRFLNRKATIHGSN
ncbi:hypothetical protein ACOKFD_12400 [Flagellimonas sp. S174]|uniref:hypothetical protein n=1 Tax=Flagellimonas sp. S174 TaxID=3410790 RepID=UPI003BF5EBD1